MMVHRQRTLYVATASRVRWSAAMVGLVLTAACGGDKSAGPNPTIVTEHAVISGRVLYEDATPIPAATVAIGLAGGEPGSVYRSNGPIIADADGKFTITVTRDRRSPPTTAAAMFAFVTFTATTPAGATVESQASVWFGPMTDPAPKSVVNLIFKR